MTVETANRLYELRKKHNLSQEELAERLGVSRQAVSKWERSEASPDTDNLIALAKIYGLSLDELVYGEKEEEPTEESSEEKEQTEESTEEKEQTEESSDEPLLTVEDGGNTVKIGPGGIVVEDEDGEKVKIGFSGLNIQTNKTININDESFEKLREKKAVVIDEDGHIKISVDEIERKKTKFWLEVPYAVICAIAYLVFGFYNICGGWAHSWIIFVTIPIYYSLIEAIYKRRFAEFAYPVLTAFIYLYFGLYQGNWHPSWIVFLTIPVYSPIAEALDKLIKRRRREKEEQ